MKASKARKLRALIEALADFLADAEALEGMELFPAWDGAAQYTAGRRVRFQGILYRCLQGHQAQTGWNPVSTLPKFAMAEVRFSQGPNGYHTR